MMQSWCLPTALRFFTDCTCRLIFDYLRFFTIISIHWSNNLFSYLLTTQSSNYNFFLVYPVLRPTRQYLSEYLCRYGIRYSLCRIKFPSQTLRRPDEFICSDKFRVHVEIILQFIFFEEGVWKPGFNDHFVWGFFKDNCYANRSTIMPSNDRCSVHPLLLANVDVFIDFLIILQEYFELKRVFKSIWNTYEFRICSLRDN